MNRDDPFAEPFDTDKTVIRPNPAGRRPAAPTPMPPPDQASQPGPGPAAMPARASRTSASRSLWASARLRRSA